MIDGRPLSNTAGAVLDPIFSLRCRVRVPPGETVRVAFWTLIAPTRRRRSISPTSIRDPTAFERVGTLAWTQAQVQLHHLGIEPDEAHLFQRLANRVLLLRSDAAAAARRCSSAADGSISALWAHGISGDLPIVLVRIDDVERPRASCASCCAPTSTGA